MIFGKVSDWGCFLSHVSHEQKSLMETVANSHWLRWMLSIPFDPVSSAWSHLHGLKLHSAAPQLVNSNSEKSSMCQNRNDHLKKKRPLKNRQQFEKWQNSEFIHQQFIR